MRKKFLLMLTLLILALGGGGNLFAQNVAKVGDTEYATIDEAIDNWTNGTTLTLLADVTMSDVVTLNSTEHHILDLGTYTMTAVRGKNAFVIKACGTGSSESTAITINADATNPGGINARSQSVIYYKYADGGISTEDHPIIEINGGVFKGSTDSNGRGIYTEGSNTSYAVLNISGGEFYCKIRGNTNKLIISGGTFHQDVGSMGNETAYRKITGGRFIRFEYMSCNNENVFAIGSDMEKYDVGVYIDADGYLCVGGPVITELSAKYPAKASNYSFGKWGNWLKYSSAATYGLFYEDVDMAINKHGEKNVTIWVVKPAVTISENVTGDAAVVEEIANNTALNGYTPENLPTGAELEIVLNSVVDKYVYDVTPMANGVEVEPIQAITFRLPVPASVTEIAAKVYHEGTLMGVYNIQGEGNAKYVEIASADFSEFAVEPIVPVAQIGTENYATLDEAITAAQNGETIILIADVELTAQVVIPEGKELTLDLNGKTVTVPEDTKHIYALNNKGTLTIKDSNGNGSISARGIYNGYDGVSSNNTVEGAKLIIESGKFIALDSDGGAAIFNCAELVIYDGTFKGIVAAVNNRAMGVATIKGGTFAGGYDGGKSTNYIIQNNGGSLTINGANVVSGFGAVGCYSGETIINGGSFLPTGWEGYTCHVVYVAGAANVTINGGTFKMNYPEGSTPDSGSAVASYYNGTVLINGGSFTSHFDNVSPVELSNGATIKGGTYLTHSGNASNHTYIKNYLAENFELGADGIVVAKPVAQIGETTYTSIEDAIAAATAGSEIKLLANIGGDITVPANVTLNGNGFAISGGITAAGKITFAGETKSTSFNVENTNTVVNIPAGASLQLTGTGRMVIGHGCTFNITGTIADAKNANVADVTPSLVMPGASFTGAGVTFNVTNAYIKATAYCSSKNSSASNTFNFNITNSIWEQTGSFVFTEPTSGKDPIFNLNFKDGVLNSTSHLVFAVTKGEIVFDNSNVNGENARKQIENRSNLTVKNGSVVYGAVATSSNAKNPGTLTVENATYNVTGEFSGSDVGTGTLVIKNNANVTIEKITKANIVIDAAEMTAGELANFTANLSNFAGELSVINNNKLEAQIVDGKIVLVAKPVAKIGETPYATLEDAFKAATSGCTIDILLDVTVDYAWDARNTGGKFTVPVTINGNGKTIKFTASVNDNNNHAPFRFEADAIVNDLTIDMSECTDIRFRAISSKANLTVNGCTFIGKDKSLNCRAIIFGEGAGANVGNLEVSITESEFINWKRGITDNENAQDVKKVTIEGNTLTDAAVYVSAYNNVTFERNTTNSDVDIRSYTVKNSLKVTATNNTLTGETYYIKAGGNIVAQDEFVIAPRGNQPIAYVQNGSNGKVRVWGETWGNAKESYALKLYSGDTHIATTTLNNINGIIDGDVNVTWSFSYPGGETGGYWTTIWHQQPRANQVPNKVVLVIDGIDVNDGPVYMSGPDGINPVNWEDLGGVMTGGTWGGIDWILVDSTLTIAPTTGTPGTDNSGKWSYEVGQWPEAVRYNSNGVGVAVEGWPYDRSKVKTLFIEEGVTSIGSFTAQGFTNLTGEVVIPYTVKYIGQEAFQKSTFTKITFAPVPEGKTGEELCIAQGALKNLVIEEITFPEDRPVHLHAWMFANSNNLKHVTLPATIKSINGTTHVDYNHNPNQTNGGGANTSDILGKCPAVETITFGSQEVRDLYYNPGWTRTDAPIVVNVGLKSYKDFRAGIDAAKDGETVLMLGNVTLEDTWTIPAGMNLTLNLNGKTISQSKDCTASYEMINNKGNLTITGKGNLSFTDTSAGDSTFGWGSYTVRNEGNLVVENATIEHKGAQEFAKHMICAIFQYSGSTTINGGTISTPNYRSARLWKGDMTINGGTFDGQLWVQAVDNSAKLTINGGTFEPNGQDASAVFVTNADHDAKLAVTNGTFKGKVGCSDATKLAGTITGGMFTETAKNGTNSTLLATGLTFGEADANGYYTVQDDPTTHYINNVEELKAFRDEVNSGNTYAGVTVYLAADIDLEEEDWTPITKFNGTFDGQDYTISNLWVTGSDNCGFFKQVADQTEHVTGTVKNVNFENATIISQSGNGTAGIIADARLGARINNVNLTGEVTIQGYRGVGGIVGAGFPVIEGCTVEAEGSITATYWGAGGILGFASDKGAKAINSTVKGIGEGLTIHGEYGGVGSVTGTPYGAAVDGATINDVNITSNNDYYMAYVDASGEVKNANVDNVVVKVNGNVIVGCDAVATIGTKPYFTFADAVAAAENNATINLIWKEGKAPIAMNASLYGKSVTITGTAKVDWSKGWLFVGRGGEGNATLTFDEAYLTSASDNSTYGIHVSGREKNTDNKYDGTVVIKNSTIELDYLINRGTMTLDATATLTVKNGFGIAGRPASETESGDNATATLTLKNNSKVVVNYHNGMGLGQAANVLEGLGVMNINSGSTFECTQDFLVTANGTMNVNGGVVTIAENKKLDNNGAVVVTGNSKLYVKNYNGNAIQLNNGNLVDTYFAGRIDAFGTNNISGTTTIGGILGLGYGTNPNEQVVVNITGNFNGTNVLVSTNDVDNLLNVGNANGERTTVHFAQLGAFADVNVVNADVTYGYAFIRNDFNATNSTFEIKGGVNTYFAGNAKVVLDNTTWNLKGYANIGSYGGYMYGNADVTLKNGSSMTATNLGIEVNGEKVVKLTLEDNSSLTATKLTNQGTIVLAGEEATLTSNECANVTTSVDGMVVLYKDGKYTLVPPIAKIDGTPYATLQAAVNAAKEGETITLLRDVAQEDGVIITDKKLTIDLNQKTFTVTNGASTNNRNFKINGASVVTIMNGTMVAAGDYSSGAYGTVRTEGTANVTLTGLKLYNYRGNGLNIKAYAGTTVAIDNTEIYSQYGGGIEAAGGTITLAETVKVEQKGMYTAPYNSMAISVNGGGKVTVNGGTYSTECITAEEANNQGTSHGPWVVGVLNSGGTLIINGGTFSNDNFGDNSLATAARGAVLADTGANIEINGGTFNALKAIIDITNNLGDATKNPSAVLSGGTFSADPTVSGLHASHLIKIAKYYTVVENEGIYSVVKDYVAQVGEERFVTLQEAFNAGGEVVVLKNITLEETATVAKGQVVTLNLNGKTISAAITEQLTKSFAAIQNRGTLTVKDSATTRAAGRITVSYAGTTFGYGIGLYTISNEGGVLNIESGIVENTTTVSGSMYDAIDNNSTLGETVLNITGGEVRCPQYIGVRQFANNSTYENIVNVTGGKVVGGNTSIWMQNPGNGNPKATIAISGDANIEGRLLAGTSTGFTFNVTGGTFTDNPSAFVADNYDAIEQPNGTWVVKQTSGTQTREFASEGWYWFSTYINLYANDADGLDIFKSAFKDENEKVKVKQIKGQDGYIGYNSAWGIWTNGGLMAITNSDMYMINMNDAHTLNLTGEFAEEGYEIPLYEGWNWIGYPVNEEINVTDALANLDPKTGDIIKSQNKAAYYTGTSWKVELGWSRMIPGQGYKYYRKPGNGNTSLIYSTEVKPSSKSDENREFNHWFANAAQYPSNMTVIAMLNIDGEAAADNYEVAAFANGECRGSARPFYVEEMDTYVMIMTINGEEVEELTFKCYDVNYGTEYELSNRFNYSDDAILGSIDEPYMFFMNTLGIEESTLDMINIYPNPTTRDRAINLQATCDNVEVFNALGVKIAEYQNVDTIDALETAGVYVIRVTINGEVKNCRLVVE